MHSQPSAVELHEKRRVGTMKVISSNQNKSVYNAVTGALNNKLYSDTTNNILFT